jgi:hypothetical protein
VKEKQAPHMQGFAEMVRDKRAFHQLTVQMPLQALSPNFREIWVGKILCYRKGNFSRIPVRDKFLLLA